MLLNPKAETLAAVVPTSTPMTTSAGTEGGDEPIGAVTGPALQIQSGAVAEVCARIRDRVGPSRGVITLVEGAPGVGKTHAMLSEGHRRQARGTDVVVGLAEAHGRAPVLELLEGLDTGEDAAVELGGWRTGIGVWAVVGVLALVAWLPQVRSLGIKDAPGGTT